MFTIEENRGKRHDLFYNAATTCVFPSCAEAMQDAMQVTYGIHHAKHMKGIEAENKVKLHKN